MKDRVTTPNGNLLPKLSMVITWQQFTDPRRHSNGYGDLNTQSYTVTVSLSA